MDSEISLTSESKIMSDDESDIECQSAAQFSGWVVCISVSVAVISGAVVWSYMILII
jgi:hypothetical protein